MASDTRTKKTVFAVEVSTHQMVRSIQYDDLAHNRTDQSKISDYVSQEILDPWIKLRQQTDLNLTEIVRIVQSASWKEYCKQVA